METRQRGALLTSSHQPGSATTNTAPAVKLANASKPPLPVINTELSMGWVDPRVGLGWVGLGWVGWLG